MLCRSDKLPIAAAFLCVFTLAGSQTFEQQMEAEVEKLVAKNGKGTEKRLAQRLRWMARRDQAVRTTKNVPKAASETLVKEQEQADLQLTTELKEIIATYGNN